MKNYYYEYEIQVIDLDDKIETCRGIVNGVSYLEVVNSIVNYYGNDTIVAFNKLICIMEDLYEFNGLETSFKVKVKSK